MNDMNTPGWPNVTSNNKRASYVPNRASHPNRQIGGYNPIGKTDLNIVRSGASGAFKKMGVKTPIERAKARESRPGKPPLPGF